MGNYENLKQSITEVIRTNGNQEITGAVLQSTLLTIISTVGANATFAGIATPTTNPGTPDGPVFYLASESGTYSNFNAIELQDGLSVLMWNGSWSSQQIFGVDDEPTAGSDNLVKSGGVQEELALGAVYDVSAKNPTAGVNNDGKFESLSALLGDANLDTLIPVSVRKGGMSIKFVQSSDNEYVQYMLKKNTWSADVNDWTKINLEDEVSQLEREIKDEYNIEDSVVTGETFKSDVINVHIKAGEEYIIDSNAFSSGLMTSGYVYFNVGKTTYTEVFTHINSFPAKVTALIDSTTLCAQISSDRVAQSGDISFSIIKTDTVVQRINNLEENVTVLNDDVEILNESRKQLDAFLEPELLNTYTTQVGYVDKNTHNIVSSTTTWTTRVYDVHSIVGIRLVSLIVKGGSVAALVAEYDENDNWIRNLAVGSQDSRVEYDVISKNAYYIKVCSPNSDLDTIKVWGTTFKDYDALLEEFSTFSPRCILKEENTCFTSTNWGTNLNGPVERHSNTNVSTYVYDVEEYSKIRLSGSVIGFLINVFFVDGVSNNLIDVSSWTKSILKNIINSENTPFETTTEVFGKYLCITVSNNTDEPTVFVDGFDEKVKNTDTVKEIEEELDYLNDSYSKLVPNNKIWVAKNDVDKLLAQCYPTHNIAMLNKINARTTLHNVRLSNAFVVPNVGSNVTISITDNPDVTNSYSTTEKYFLLNDEICIGTKDMYDVYQIVSIDNTDITIKLIQNNLNLVGETLPISFSFVNASTTSVVYVSVYKRRDILAYESNELPRSLSFDGVHPNTDTRNMICHIFAEALVNKFGDRHINLYSFGDSWTAEAGGWRGIVDILGSDKVTIMGSAVKGYGEGGDRIENIITRFSTFLGTYTPNDDDVFLFVMGTNNLLDMLSYRNPADKDYGRFITKSYIETMTSAVEYISQALPKGNWLVANGHCRSDQYKII